MRSEAERELYDWLDQGPTAALDELLHALTEQPGLLMRRNWTDGIRQCLAEFLGRRHPECKDEAHPGIAFLRLVGRDTSVSDSTQLISAGSYLVADWDNPERGFRRALIRIIRRELSYRSMETKHVSRDLQRTGGSRRLPRLLLRNRHPHHRC